MPRPRKYEYPPEGFTNKAEYARFIYWMNDEYRERRREQARERARLMQKGLSK